jgi:hypothetical protein
MRIEGLINSPEKMGNGMRLIWVLTILGLIAGSFCACGTSHNNLASFEAVPKKETDQIEVSLEKQAAVFDIFSPGGIGGAEVKLASGTLPETILLRLHLRGLEEFRLTAGNKTLLAAVSSHGDNSIQESISAKSNDIDDWRTIDPDSPYWMDIQIVDPEAKSAPKIPLEDGYFEVTIPRFFIKTKISAFSIRWIDFYRE